jgi:hypothetical protein
LINVLAMTFTKQDLRRGQRAMERALTTAGKIRRQFAAGRPPKPGNWDTRSALRTIAARLDALTGVMQAEGLNPRDLTAVMVIGEFVEGLDKLATEHISGHISFLPLVIKGKSHLSAAVDELLPNPKRVVIGTVFQVQDHESPEPLYLRWANPAFRDVDGAAEQVLTQVLERMARTGKWDA